MRELEFMVIQLQQSVMRLQEGLDTSATGRLSSVLIPPHNLSKILQDVMLKLPQDVSLIAGFTIENMYVYYEVAKVQAYANTTAIRLVVRLPLRGADRVMTLFRSVPLLVFFNPLLFASCTNTFSKWCKITRGNIIFGSEVKWAILLTFKDGRLATMSVRLICHM
jgi:hypothetical protein